MLAAYGIVERMKDDVVDWNGHGNRSPQYRNGVSTTHEK